VEGDGSRYCPRGHVVGSAEGRQEIVECYFVRLRERSICTGRREKCCHDPGRGRTDDGIERAADCGDHSPLRAWAN
jgi:hypothetical protein